MVTNMELSEPAHGIMGTCCTALGWSKDILGRNRIPGHGIVWIYIKQLTGMSWDIPRCPSWDCIPLVRMSRDILEHNRMCWIWDCLDIQQLTGMSWDIP